MVDSEAAREPAERKKVRVRVMKGSRTWRWKVLGAACLAVALLVGCAIYVPRWLSSMASESGGGGAPAEPAPAP